MQDATLALTLLEGLQLGGRMLRFGRPADYKPPPPHLADYVVGGPLIPTTPAQAALSGQTQAQAIGAAAGITVAPTAVPAVAGMPPLPTVPGMPPLPGAPAVANTWSNPPTKVVMLTNMITLDDLKDAEEYDDLLDDIRTECSKYGSIVSLNIPRPGDTPADVGVGKVFIEYEAIEAAQTAQTKLNGRSFASSKIQASFYDEEKYQKKEF